MDETVILYRPVGAEELKLIERSGFKEFPPRLPEQPIFYPVTSEEYAVQIARDWNARLNSDRTGFVTKFHVARAFLNRYERHVVGSSVHEEYWIPSEKLSEFNASIVGQIEVIAEFHGESSSHK